MDSLFLGNPKLTLFLKGLCKRDVFGRWSVVPFRSEWDLITSWHFCFDLITDQWTPTVYLYPGMLPSGIRLFISVRTVRIETKHIQIWIVHCSISRSAPLPSESAWQHLPIPVYPQSKQNAMKEGFSFKSPQLPWFIHHQKTMPWIWGLSTQSINHIYHYPFLLQPIDLLKE